MGLRLRLCSSYFWRSSIAYVCVCEIPWQIRNLPIRYDLTPRTKTINVIHMADKRAPKRAYNYDYSEVIILAKGDPGEWYVEDDPARSKITAHDIRRGMPLAFGPAGSFDALQRKDGLYLRYLGAPVYPWCPELGDPRTFDQLERTFDEDRAIHPAQWRPNVAARLAAGLTLAEVHAQMKAEVADRDRAEQKKAKKAAKRAAAVLGHAEIKHAK